MATQQDIQAWQAFVDADPEIQAILRRTTDTNNKTRDLGRLFTRRGLKNPEGVTIDTDTGQVQADHFWRDVGLGALAIPASVYGLDKAIPKPSANPSTAPSGDLETPGTVNVDGSGGGGNPLGALGSQVGSRLVNAAFQGLSGLPALFANRNPSPQEDAYTAQAQRLLGQQEQRTQFQNPLYAAATRSAYNLLPQGATQGNPFPYNGLSDVNVPGLEDLLNAQRKAQGR